MSRFSLSKSKEMVLPDTVTTVSGNIFFINPGYRNILRIFRMLSDPEILPSHKPLLLKKWFYIDSAPEDYISVFNQFLTDGKQQQSGYEKQDFCFEFDAKEIYSAFWKEYGIDLLQTDLHWYQFQALLLGAVGGENALSRKMRLRTLDTSKYSNKSELEYAKAMVQIPMSIGRTEQTLNDKISEALEKGEDITLLLRQVKESAW